MIISRRQALGVLAAAAPALRRASAQPSAEALEIAPGPFKGTRESLRDYRIPEWFRDAKFGIWAHWGPHSSADWHRRLVRPQHVHGRLAPVQSPSGNLRPSLEVRIQGTRARLERRALRPELPPGACTAKPAPNTSAAWACITTISTCGTPSSSPVGMPPPTGPKKDIVGLFAEAARLNGLKFAVSEHLAISYNWFADLPCADTTRTPRRACPTTAPTPPIADLYHETPEVPRNAKGEADRWSRQRAGFLEAALLRAHQGPGGSLPARPALHRRRASPSRNTASRWWRTSIT